MSTSEHPASVEALSRHFADLRDGTHGGVRDRTGKERLFAVAVEVMDPVVRGVLQEIDDGLLRGTGTVTATGATPDGNGGMQARWTLSWPEQRGTDLPPLQVLAHFGRSFHHPHLRGVTVGDWPLNIFSTDDAAAALPTLRAIVAADLHNLVYQRDFRIVPGVTGGA